MKKINLIKCLIATTFALTSFSSCSTSKIVDIAIKSGYSKTVEYGKFNASDYTIVATYSNGSTKEIPVTDDMISDVSKVRLNSVGKQQIEIVYLKTSIYIDITIERATFDVSIPNQIITYDGQPHSLVINGYYPKGTTITYPNGSSFTNVGHYDVEAILSCDNYETATITAEITILAADYNLDIKFDDKTYTYDEEEHALEIEGTLPSEVKVTYTIQAEDESAEEGNSAVDAGTYNVTASFTSSNLNYNPIPSITKTLTIAKADYDTENISIGPANKAYTGQEIEWKIVNTLPNWITVTYENTYDPSQYEYKEGETPYVVDNSACYVQKETGIYTCVIHLEIIGANKNNYNDIEPLTFEVNIYEE